MKEYYTAVQLQIKTDANILKNEDVIENGETGKASTESNMDVKNDKSPGVDDIPAEVLRHGGPGIIDALTVVCQKIWTSKPAWRSLIGRKRPTCAWHRKRTINDDDDDDSHYKVYRLRKLGAHRRP